MFKDGLPKDAVLAVLRKNGVKVDSGEDPDCTVLSKGTDAESHYFYDRVSREELDEIARKFKIGLFEFYKN